MPKAVAAVVGCGNIGGRALQALARLGPDVQLYAVDHAPAALALARQRIAELGLPADRARFVEHLTQLPARVDLALLATCADARRGVIEALLDHTLVRHLVIEKFAFQRRDDYAAVQTLLNAKNTAGWVNLVRRVWPGYAALRHWLAGAPSIEMQVMGRDFRLASNAIHYLDLYAFLSGVHVRDLDGRGLDGAVRPSGRAGYREACGILRGQGAGGAPVTLTSLCASKLPVIVQIMAPSVHCIVHELEAKAWYVNADTDWSWRDIAFPTVMMSEMTACYGALLAHGTCALPRFEESAVDHVALIEVLNRHWFGETSAAMPCPIT